MNLFQCTTIALTVILITIEAAQFCRSGWRVSAWRCVRVFAWTFVALGVATPASVTSLARTVGIQRGADLVLYVTCLAFVSCSFLFYSRCMAIERRLTVLVRRQAIQNAVRGCQDRQEAGPSMGDSHHQ